jgi:type I restriction enzyme, R subunit
LTAAGFRQGLAVGASAGAWVKKSVLFPEQLTAFFADTQPKLWDGMPALHARRLEVMLINALVKKLAIKGSLHVLRHEFKRCGKTFQTAYFKPAHSLNAE